jgi:hypothetical protein
VVVVRKREPPGQGPEARRLRIAAVSASFPGRTHDKRVYDAVRVVAPRDARRAGDTAYLGTALEMPARKPRGGELTERQKAGDRELSGAGWRPSMGSAR